MTDEELRHIVDVLSRRSYPPIRTSFDDRRTEEYMAERQWINKVFMDSVVEEAQDGDRHPRFHMHYMGHWPKPQGECSRVSRRRPLNTRVSDWAMEQCAKPKEPAELTAGDTSQLDDFLCGFVKQEV